MTRRQAYTFVEVLTALVIATAMASIVLALWRSLFNADSRHSVTGITRSSYTQKDAKAGVRRLMYRLREGIQITDPQPGKSGDALEFQDVTNSRIRIRLDPADHRVISEAQRNNQWVRETAPDEVDVGGRKQPASWPVTMPNCTALKFTVVSPECAAMEATVEADGQTRLVVTAVKLRNANIAY